MSIVQTQRDLLPHPSPGTVSTSGRSDGLIPRAQMFIRDTAGDIALMFGLAFFAMMALIGLAVDVGRWLNARDQTMAAMDAAVLAGGRALQTNGGNQAGAVAVATRYYQEAIKTRIPTLSDTIKFTVADNGTAITATGNAFIRTPLMNAAMVIISDNAHTKLPLLPTSNANYSKATLAVGGNAELNLEVAMMLDVSGSMANQKIADMKLAAEDLVKIVVWQDQSKFFSKVSIVPFSADVRPPTDFPTTARTTPIVRYQRSNGQWYNRTVCVGERGGSNRYTDAAPVGAANLLTTVHRPVGSQPSSTATANCQTPANGAVQPLTADKTLLINKIKGLTVGGGTAGHIGTAWAYYTLSPNWGSVFTGASAPTAYGVANTKKIAILMTDGEYNYTYKTDATSGGAITAAGGTTESGGGGNHSQSINQTSAANQAVQICTQMKSRGIDVYTVGFDLGGNTTAINTLTSCATNPGMAYNADNGEELRQAFRDIALKISSLYLSK